MSTQAVADLQADLQTTLQVQRLARVREQLAASPLVAAGGALRTRVLAPATLADLVRDALAAHREAAEARVEPDPDAERGEPERGNPERWLESAPGGPALARFTGSAEVLDVLTRATGVTWRPAGPGTWSYYRREGHHLGVHRDLSVCDLAVITCVCDRGGEGQQGLLRLWPTRAGESSDAIRRDPRDAHHLRLRTGETLLLLGGLVPHQLLPLGPRQLRIVAPLCYQAVA